MQLWHSVNHVSLSSLGPLLTFNYDIGHSGAHLNGPILIFWKSIFKEEQVVAIILGNEAKRIPWTVSFNFSF